MADQSIASMTPVASIVGTEKLYLDVASADRRATIDQLKTYCITGAVVPTRTLFAGAGLAGGGDLSADRTFNVGAGTGITVNADDVALTVPVAVVNGGTGGTTAATARTGLGLGNVDNTSDLSKPISTATQTALNLKADLASPFTSTVNGVAPASGGGTANFLRADGTWQTPPGGGGGISDAPSDNNYYERRNATWVSRGSSVLVAIATSGSASDLSAGTVPTARMPAHTGDVTSSAGAVALTVANNAVTYAKMQDVTATSRFVGRITAGAGDPEELTGTQATTLLDVFTTSLKGLAPSSGGGTTNFLRADGTWQVPPGSGGLADGDKGEITVATGGTVWTIDNNAVTYAKMQDVSATSRFIGRITAAAGDPEELTGTQATTLLDVFTTSLKGLAPSSGGGTTNFLRADGAWQVPPGSGAPTTRNLTAGAGLTGGGDLSADRTFTVGAGTGITVNADDVALTVPIAIANGGTNATTAATGFSNLKQAATTGATGVIQLSTDAQVRSATGTVAVVATQIETAAAFVALTDGTNVAVDWDTAINWSLTVAGNRTISNPTNGQIGTYRTILVQGSSATARTISWGTNYLITPTITDCTSTKWYLLTIFCVSGTHFIVTAVQAK